MVALSTALEDNSRDSSGWTYWQNTVKEQANLELTMSCMSSMWQMQSLTQVFTTCESWIRTMGWRNWNSGSNPVTKVDAYDVDEDSGLTCMAHSPHFILFSHRRSHKLYKLWTPPPNLSLSYTICLCQNQNAKPKKAYSSPNRLLFNYFLKLAHPHTKKVFNACLVNGWINKCMDRIFDKTSENSCF